MNPRFRLPAMALLSFLVACSGLSPRAEGGDLQEEKLESKRLGVRLEQAGPSFSKETLTPVPTLGSETRWQEPQANAAIVLALPSDERGGQDLYLIQPDGEPPMRLANVQDVIASASASPDGRWLALKTTAWPGVRRDRLLLLSLTDLSLRPVIEATAVYTFNWLSDSASALVFENSPRDRVQHLQLYTPSDGSLKLVMESGPPGHWSILGQALGGQRVLLGHFHGGGLLYDAAALLDPVSGAAETLYLDERKLTSFILPAPNGQVALVMELESLGRVEQTASLLDLTDGSLRTLSGIGQYGTYVSGLPVWSPDSRRFAYASAQTAEEKGGGPVQILVYEVETGELTLVKEVPEPAFLSSVLAWASDSVLIVDNLRGEPLEMFLYSIRTDGSGEQRISPGRFLAVVLLVLP